MLWHQLTIPFPT